MATEISEDTMIKIRPRTAYGVALALLSLGGIYFMLKDGLSQTQRNTEKIEAIPKMLEEIKFNDEKRADKLEKELRTFFQAEIDGLRSDWERRYRDNLNRRLEYLEKK